jgi:integrase
MCHYVPKQLGLFDPPPLQKPEAVGSVVAAAHPEPHCPPDEDNGPLADPASPTSSMTLEDVLAVLLDSACDLKRASALRSCVRAVGRVLGRPLDQIPADIAVLQPLLAEARPALVGMKPRTWIQTKSSFRAALAYCEIAVMPGRDCEPLLPEWEVLIAATDEVRLKRGLSRLLHFLSAERIGPDVVTVEDVRRFGERLRTGSLHPRPATAYRNSIRLWNLAVQKEPGWPNALVELDDDPRRYSLDWAAFSPLFYDDVEAFLSAKTKSNWFSSDYARPVRPRTIEGRRRMLRQLASALVLTGFRIEDLTDLNVLTEPRNASAALEWHLQRRGARTEGIENLARLLLTISRVWTKNKVSEEELKAMVSDLHVPHAGMTERNEEKLRQFDVERNTEALLLLPTKVYRHVGKSEKATFLQATGLMYALAVQILIVAPIRLENLHKLNLSTQIREVRNGRRVQRRIVLAPETTKTSRAYEAPLPEEINWMMDAWLSRYRKVVWPGQTDLIFPSPRGGGVRAPEAFSAKLSKFIARELGLDVNTHLFRQLAGKLYLEFDDRGIETVSQVLGHTNPRTTLRSYAKLPALRAHERYQQNIVVPKLRSASPSKQQQRP